LAYAPWYPEKGSWSRVLLPQTLAHLHIRKNRVKRALSRRTHQKPKIDFPFAFQQMKNPHLFEQGAIKRKPKNKIASTPTKPIPHGIYA